MYVYIKKVTQTCRGPLAEPRSLDDVISEKKIFIINFLCCHDNKSSYGIPFIEHCASMQRFINFYSAVQEEMKQKFTNTNVAVTYARKLLTIGGVTNLLKVFCPVKYLAYTSLYKIYKA